MVSLRLETQDVCIVLNILKVFILLIFAFILFMKKKLYFYNKVRFLDIC